VAVSLFFKVNAKIRITRDEKNVLEGNSMSAESGQIKKVSLWSRQDIKSLAELENNGTIRITRKHLLEKFDVITDYIAGVYQWFVEAADRRVARPEGVEFPVWCSVSSENMLRPTKDTVVYVLEVDESEVIYFDSFKWDYVLNHLYIPKDAADDAAYKREMLERGHRNLYSFVDSSTAHFYPRERKQVIDSWERIFEIEQWDIFRIQANIWEIRSDMVKDVLYCEDSAEE
jgi:hypothetical protein